VLKKINLLTIFLLFENIIVQISIWGTIRVPRNWYSHQVSQFEILISALSMIAFFLSVGYLIFLKNKNEKR